MPDLAGRAEHEERLRAAIAAALAAWESEPNDYRGLRLRVRDAAAEPLALTYIVAAEQLGSRLRPDSFSTPRADAEAWAARMSAHVAAGVAEATQDALQRARQAGDAAAVASAIALLADPERARTIAITETTRAASVGELEEVERYEAATGLRVATVWTTEQDGRVCPICEPLDGLWRARWSREFPWGPPAHPRCRCYLEHKVL